MSEAQAAAYLNLNPRTLQRYRRKGALAYREAKGKTRTTIEYDRADIDRLNTELEAKRARSKKPQTKSKITAQRIAFGLTSEEYAEVAKEAENFGMGVGEYARRLMREGLESRFQSEAAELRNRIKQVRSRAKSYAQRFCGSIGGRSGIHRS